jgi:hypothetical protein
MTTAQQEIVVQMLKRVFNADNGWKAVKKHFDRSFIITLDEEHGKVVLVFETKDSGQEFMTVADLAIILQTTRQKVRALTHARAQKSSRHPVPFFKINGKSLRFKRSSIMEWLGAMNAEKPVFAPAKGKGRK